MQRVKSGDKVKVHYHGRLTNGETFDKSEEESPWNSRLEAVWL
jgi:peptidylprolyl isomerase